MDIIVYIYPTLSHIPRPPLFFYSSICMYYCEC